MEDHLKNKDRLHEEWEALCNYEADMCSTKVGTSNPSKNRHKEALPCKYTLVSDKNKHDLGKHFQIHAPIFVIIENVPVVCHNSIPARLCG